jgi:hypothetical protein
MRTHSHKIAIALPYAHKEKLETFARSRGMAVSAVAAAIIKIGLEKLDVDVEGQAPTLLGSRPGAR